MSDSTPEPVTDHVHESSWSANLELPRHADDRALTVEQALDAVRKTASGYHVNLVTHGNHGHPETYLFDELRDAFDDAEYRFVERCGCGGYVTRVHVE
ncbi:CGCGG family putative rSAM-modified RiPP protein [Halomicrococcus sp. SG-WS-1]|uniref:CGCGG family putative rSAM-modified RiPP protein n=1 Tax=Halomicrococcus sp. SG-WS-1 TaxID=3439057 RepID=UPI003F7ABA51